MTCDNKIMCDRCKKYFEREDREFSHDIPRWIGGTDLDGRHWVCKKCHGIWEWGIVNKKIWDSHTKEKQKEIHEYLKRQAIKFFREDDESISKV